MSWTIGTNEIRQVVALILIFKDFEILTNMKVFRSLFDKKPVKEGPGWHTFQKKNVAGNFIVKLQQSIHD